MAQPAARRHPGAVPERHQQQSTHSAALLCGGLSDCGSPSTGQVLTTAPQPASPAPGGAYRHSSIDSGPNAMTPFWSPPPARASPSSQREISVRASGEVRRTRRHQLRVLRLRTWLGSGPRPHVRGGDRRCGALARAVGAGGIVVAFWCSWCSCCRRCVTVRPRFRWRWWHWRRPVRGNLPRAWGQPATAPPAGHLVIIATRRGIIWAAIELAGYRAVRAELHRQRVSGQRVDQRSAADRVRTIGSLGVLNDVTVTQASTVFELAHLGGDTTRRAIFVSAIRMDATRREHGLHAGTGLRRQFAGLLLLFSVANRSLSDVLTGESVAIEVVALGGGRRRLALSVPLTTAIAAVLAKPAGSAPVPQLQQITAIPRLDHGEARAPPAGPIQPWRQATLLGNADLQEPCRRFEVRTIIAGVQQRVEGAGVQPRRAARETSTASRPRSRFRSG